MTETVQKSVLMQPTMFDSRLITILLNLVDPFKIIRKLIVKPATSMLIHFYEDYKSKTQKNLVSTQKFALRIFVMVTILFLLICGAVLMYALFYLTYMPSSVSRQPIYMQYNKICDDKTCSDGTSPFHSFPTAHVQLSKTQLMMVGQPYIITVRLELPETPRNEDQGMFLICVDMKDAQNLLKSHACRSTMLRYRSPLLQKIKTIVYMPFYIMGYREQKQELDIEIFSHFVDSTNSVTDIYVEIQSKIVEFYSVTLHITAHFSGLRYIMFHFPIISALVGIVGNLITLVLITLLCWYHWDNELEWIEEARKKYVGKDKLNYKESSSITTTDENFSVLESDSHGLEDDDFFFEKEEQFKENNKKIEE